MKEYNIAVIRKLLKSAFTAQELKRFCQERPVLRPICDEFGPNHGLNDMIDRVIDYCQAQAIWEELLAEIKEAKPKQFERHQTQMAAGTSARPPVRHNLPPIGIFVNREHELDQISKRLLPEDTFDLVNIVGPNGIGKTTLALKAGHHYLRQADFSSPAKVFELIVWVSAEKTLLTTTAEVKCVHAAHTLGDIFAAIGKTLDRDDIVRAPLSEQKELVTKALANRRTLLIVGNIEAIEDREVLDFLRQPPLETRIIVTASQLLNLGYRIPLAELPWENAHTLIEQECCAQGIQLSQGEQRKLYEATGGVPLALKWSIAQMGFSCSLETVLDDLFEPGGDIARRCFEGTVGLIRDTPAYPLLLASTLFPKDASRQALGYVAGLGDDHRLRDNALKDLVKLSLLQWSGARFSLLSLTRAYVQNHLREPETHDQLRRNFVDYFLDLSRKYGTPENWLGGLPWRELRLLETESLNLVQAAHWAYGLGRWSDCIELEFRTFISFGIYDHWDERLELGQLALEALEHLPATQEWREHRARIWIDSLGWVYRNRRQFDKMRHAIDKGLAVARSLAQRNRDLEAIAACYLSRAALEDGDLQAVHSIVENGLSEQEELHLGTVARLKTMQGRALEAEGNLEGARSLYTEALEIRQHVIGELVGVAENKRRLAQVEFKLGNLRQAKDLYQQSKEMTEQYGRTLNLARIYLGLARIAQVEEEWTQAIEWAKQALALFEHLDMPKEAAEAKQLIAALGEKK